MLLPALLPPPAGSASSRGRVEPPRSPGQPFVYRASLAVSESLQPFLREAARDSDSFPDERVAEALIARLSELRPGPATARPRTTWALVLVARGQSDQAIEMLQAFLERTPAYENAYLTLAKIYLAADRREEGLRVLDRLLARNPSHAAARELAARFR